ncbi:MAG TPA: N-acetylneuraminate synthase [Candidatus Limnocylindrales bacterium]|nr:N-acetylneuraminate synthase [Candidatus Limnocylindrales bacterium]
MGKVKGMALEIAGRRIAEGERPFVIAEGGVNHNGSVELALQLVDAAAEAGADAVKFQTFSAEAMVLKDAPQAEYQLARAPARSQLDMLRRLELPADSWPALAVRANARGIVFLSTPFDLASVELLAALGVPAFKVGSGELTNLVLLRAVAAQGRPVLLSTGMADLAEVEAAVDDLRRHGDPPLALLQCTSAYPAPAEEAHLRAMATLRDRFRVPVGYSDHTLGIATATAAAALGAALIEKHLTLDRTLPGPDHAASLEPGGFRELVEAVGDAWIALGDGTKAPRPHELEASRLARRSLVSQRAVTAGSVLGADDIGAMRPAGGISPLRLDEVIGRRAARDLAAGEPLSPTDLAPPL